MLRSLRKLWKNSRLFRAFYWLCCVLWVFLFARMILWRVNLNRLHEVMCEAAKDMPEWNWSEQWATGGPEFEKENLARDVDDWQLARGFDESLVNRFKHPAWHKDYNQWEIKHWSNPTPTSPTQLVEYHPNFRLSESTTDSLKPIFCQPGFIADMDILRSWRHRPAGRYQYAFKDLAILHLLPLVQKKRVIHNILRWDTFLKSEQGKTDEALVNLQTMQMLCRSFGDDPIMICQLVRMAIGRNSVTTLQRVLAQAESASPELLLELQNEYLLEAERNLLLAAYRGDRAFFEHDLEKISKDASLRDKFIDNLLMNGRTITATRNRAVDAWLSMAYYRYWFLPSSTGWPRLRANVLRYHNAMIELVKQPEERWIPGSAQVRQDNKETMEKFDTVHRFGHEKLLRAALSYRTTLRAAAAACAVERFRIEHQRWPQSWEEIVPKYIPAIPKDAQTGSPLFWKTVEEGIILYGVGRKGTDNNGFVVDTTAQPAQDFGIQLWSPEHRGKSRIPDPEPEKPGGSP